MNRRGKRCRKKLERNAQEQISTDENGDDARENGLNRQERDDGDRKANEPGSRKGLARRLPESPIEQAVAEPCMQPSAAETAA